MDIHENPEHFEQEQLLKKVHLLVNQEIRRPSLDDDDLEALKCYLVDAWLLYTRAYASIKVMKDGEKELYELLKKYTERFMQDLDGVIRMRGLRPKCAHLDGYIVFDGRPEEFPVWFVQMKRRLTHVDPLMDDAQRCNFLISHTNGEPKRRLSDLFLADGRPSAWKEGLDFLHNLYFDPLIFHREMENGIYDWYPRGNDRDTLLNACEDYQAFLKYLGKCGKDIDGPESWPLTMALMEKFPMRSITKYWRDHVRDHTDRGERVATDACSYLLKVYECIVLCIHDDPPHPNSREE